MPSVHLDYQSPTSARNYSLHDTNVLPATTIAISLVVSTAGILMARFHGDSTNVEIDLGVGTHFIPGAFRLVLSTGTTAVITGTRVVAYIGNPSNVNY